MTNLGQQAIYETSDESIRASFGDDRERAISYYRDMTEFVQRVFPPRHDAPLVKLLDVGCGCGWSTAALAEIGYDATGIDLNPNAFEPPPTTNLRLIPGSALEIPFPDESFEVIVSYQCLEHVPSPQKALEEMRRVCKPNGVICIIGPNLVTPFTALTFLANPSRWLYIPLRRTASLARHPNGNTWGEILGTMCIRTLQMFTKLIRRSPEFIMRTPDETPPFHADNDACYLCNPSDLIAYFNAHGYRLLRRGKHGRLLLTYPLAGGTWVAARKPQ